MEAQQRASLSHEERTAQEPRDSGILPVTLSKIELVNQNIRLLRLSLNRRSHGVEVLFLSKRATWRTIRLLTTLCAVKFLPGQWLDVFIPGLPKAGGFTITSTPYDAQPQTSQSSSQSGAPYLELAIQRSPNNPPAAWLWRPEEDILGAELIVRVGGRFTWPPPGIDVREVERVVFVAGGVGINPLISMLSTMHRNGRMPQSVRFLYSTKAPRVNAEPDDILFLPRLQSITRHYSETQLEFSLFLTSPVDPASLVQFPERTFLRRLWKDDLVSAVGEVPSRKRVLCYVCGPTRMTDSIVNYLQGLEGMDARKVLCEKWW